MSRKIRDIRIELPTEFLELCEYDMVCPVRVLRGFIGDLCRIISWADDPRVDGYNSNGSDERDFARQYYDRVGYPYVAQWVRDNVGQGKDQVRCAQSDRVCRCGRRAKVVLKQAP